MLAEKWITSFQVARLFGVNPSSVNKWAKEGKLPCYRTPGGHRRYLRADVLEFCRKQDWPVSEKDILGQPESA